MLGCSSIKRWLLVVNRKVFASHNSLNVSRLRRYNEDFVRNIKEKHLQTRQLMRGTTNSRLLAASVVLNEQVDRVHQLILLTVCQQHLPGALGNLHVAQVGVADGAANCVAYSTQMSSYETIPFAAVAGVESSE